MATVNYPTYLDPANKAAVIRAVRGASGQQPAACWPKTARR